MSHSLSNLGHRLCIVRVAIASVAALLSVESAAVAVDYEFNGPANTPADWATGSNWLPTGVPGSGDAGFINGNRIAAIGSSFTGSINNTFVGATGTGQLNLNGGSLTSGGMTVGRDSAALGTVLQTGGTLTVSGNYVSGENSTLDNKYTISAGTLNLGGESYLGANGRGSMFLSGTAAVNAHRVNIANATNSLGALQIDGGAFDSQGDVFVGLRGTGSLLLNSGSFTALGIKIGQENEATAKGTITVTGGTMSTPNAIVMGEVSHNDNQLNISGGTVSANEVYNGANGRGTVNLSGTGTLNVVGQMHVGASGTGNGALNVSGGNLNMTGPGGWILVGQNGLGSFNFSNGSINTKIISVGQDPTSTGTAVQTGGSLRAQLSFIVSETSTTLSTYSVSAGSIEVGTDGLDPDGYGIFVGSYSGKGTFNIGGTAAVSNHNGVTIGYGQGSAATGIVNVTGGSFSTLNPGVDGRVRIGVYTGSTGTLNITGGTTSFAGPILNGVAFGGVGVGGTGHVIVGGGTLSAQAMTNETGSTYVQTAGTATLGVVTGGGTMDVSGGTANVTQFTQSSLSVSGTGTVKIANAVTPAASVVNTLTAAGTGKLDITNNGVVVDYTGASPIDSIRQAIAAGRIVATLSPADPRQAVAYKASNNFGGPQSFLGVDVDTTSILIRSRLKGDADMNGKVEFDDLLVLAMNYAINTGRVWSDGDFNYDGAVNFDDLLPVAQNYNATLIDNDAIGNADFQHDWALALSTVPEPTSLAAIALSAPLLRRRRA